MSLVDGRMKTGNWSQRLLPCISTAKSRWKTIEQEAAASVWIVMFFRPVLIGSAVLLNTNHHNLTYIHGGISPKFMRCGLKLQNFRFPLVHFRALSSWLRKEPIMRKEEAKLEAGHLFNFAAVTQWRRAMSVVGSESDLCKAFIACHNGT